MPFLKRLWTLILSGVLAGVLPALADENRPVHVTGDTASHGYLIFDDIARVKEVRVFPPNPAPDEWITFTAKVTPPERGSALPVKNVTVRWRPVGEKPWRELTMTATLTDPTFYMAHLPPQGADFEYALRVEDAAGHVLQDAPVYSGAFPDFSAPEAVTALDADDAPLEVPDDLDIVTTTVARTEKHLLVDLSVAGKINKGRVAPANFHLYACFLVNRSIHQGLADILDVPAFIYAPLLNAVIPFKNGLYSFSKIDSIEALGKSRIDHPEMKHMASGSHLSMQIPFELLGKNPQGLFEVGCFTGAVDDMAKPNPLPREMGPYVFLQQAQHRVKIDTAPKPAPLKAGVAWVDVTPPIGTPLGGYTGRGGRPSTGVDSPVKAFALDLESGGREHVLVSVDIVLFTHDMFEKVVRKVEAATGLGRYQISIAATHTHNGSGAFHPMPAIITGRYNPAVQAALVEKVAQAILKAHKAKKPARLGWGVATVDMTNNRVVKDGPEDHQLTVIRVDDIKGKPMAVLFNYGTHPTSINMNYKFSPDFPGVARGYVEKAWPGAQGIFINAAQGDQSPRGLGDEYVGDSMGKQVVALTKTIQTSPDIRLGATWSKMLLSETRQYESLMQALRINDLGLLTIPGELFSQPGQEVKAFGKPLGFKEVALLGLTSDTIGYIVPKPQYHKRPYETMFCLFGDGEADFLTNLGRRLLERLGKQ